MKKINCFFLIIALIIGIVSIGGCIQNIQQTNKIGDLSSYNHNQTLKLVGNVKPGVINNCDTNWFYLEDDTDSIKIKFDNLEQYVDKRVEIVGKYFANPSTQMCASDYIIVDSIKTLE